MHAVLQPDDDHLFDLETARQREGQRILGLLGDLVKADYQYDLLREQARRVGVPSQYLWAWWHAYRERGIEGLLPIGWLPLDATSQNVVRQRLAILGELADAEEVTEEQILAIASDLEMSDRTRMRLFQRYRIGGLWGLAPHYNPLEAPSRQKRKRPPKRAAGTLDEAAFAEIDRRYQLLGEQLIKQVLREGKASRKAVRARAEEVGCSEKTLWNYLSAYREFGLQGLAPQERSDKGKSHIISP